MKYARVLLENCAKECTQFFVEYFTGRYRPKQDIIITQDETPHQLGYGAGAVNAVQ
jgi:hypothetical protein